MRHQIVTRVVVAFTLVLAAAVGAFTWLTTRPAAAVAAGEVVAPRTMSGADLFARHCAMCHDADDTGLAFRESADQAEAVARFRALLEEHYAPSPEAAEAIVEHLLSRP